MAKEDRSLQTFINRGETWLIPLDWLTGLRSDPNAREYKRRNGSVYRKPDETIGQGPFTRETRKEMLRRLLQLEEETGFSLITINELKQIDLLWDTMTDFWLCRFL